MEQRKKRWSHSSHLRPAPQSGYEVFLSIRDSPDNGSGKPFRAVGKASTFSSQRATPSESGFWEFDGKTTIAHIVFNWTVSVVGCLVSMCYHRAVPLRHESPPDHTAIRN